MKRYVKWFAAIVSVVLIFFIGMLVGSYNASKKINRLVEISLYTLDATQIKLQIGLLKLLKAGDYDTAQTKLERYLDVSLSNLAPYVIKADLKNNKEINDAIIAAKKYRQQHPGHKINPVMEKSVNKTLDFVE